MKRSLVLVGMLALVRACAGPEKPQEEAVRQEDAHGVSWSYAGETGPEHWGDLDAEFASCSTGREQSPIDIDTSRVRPGDLEPIEFDYRPLDGFEVVHNGHTIEVPVGNGSHVDMDGRRFDLLQFHFHAPSEHAIDGERAPFVVHLVHRSADGELAVVGVLMDEGEPNPAVEAVWRALPQQQGARRSDDTLDLASLLPEDRSFYRYRGSLTTPPCTEGVLWSVLRGRVGVSPDQVRAFVDLFPLSARPVQPLNDRSVTLGP